MSDQPTPEPNADTTDPTQAQSSDSTDWKSESRKWEARAKSNRVDSDRLQELETNYAETSKKLEASTEKLSGYEAKEQRAEMVDAVSKAVGLPTEAVGTLGGSTVEELTAQAERLKPFIGAHRVVIPNAGDAPDKKTSPESDFVGNLFGQGN